MKCKARGFGLLAGLTVLLLAAGCGRAPRLPTGAGPASLALDGQGKYLYVACEGSQTVIAWDLRRSRRVAEAQVAEGPLRLQLEPDPPLLRVLCRRSRRAYLLQTPDLKILKILALANGPAAWLEDRERKLSLAVYPDANLLRAYLGNNPLPVIEIGKDPVDLWLQPDTDKLWVADFKGRELAVVSLDQNRVVRRVPMPANPKKLVYSSRDRMLYALCTGEDDSGSRGVIQAVDLVYQTAGLTRSLGPGARDFALGPDGRTWYVVAPDGLHVLTEDGGEEILPAGREPQAVALAPDGSRAFVSSRADKAVYVLKLKKPQP